MHWTGFPAMHGTRAAKHRWQARRQVFVTVGPVQSSMKLGNSDLFVIELNIIYFFMFRSQNMTPKASTEVPRA